MWKNNNMKKILTVCLFVVALNISLHGDQVDKLMESYKKQCDRIQIEAEKKKQKVALFLIKKLAILMKNETRKGNLETAVEIKKLISDLSSTASSTHKSGIAFSKYYGKWDKLPDFSKLKAETTGIKETISLTEKEQAESNYGIVFSGYIKFDKSDIYTLTIASDDGSRLYIDGKLLIDNDGCHSIEEKRFQGDFGKGYHKIRVEFFQGTQVTALSVKIERSGDKKKVEIPKSMLFH
jgi:hypothetical protein